MEDRGCDSTLPTGKVNLTPLGELNRLFSVQQLFLVLSFSECLSAQSCVLGLRPVSRTKPKSNGVVGM